MARERLTRRRFTATVSGGLGAMVVAGGMGSMSAAKTRERNSGAGSGSTGLVSDPRYMDHVLEPGHPESPDRLRVITAYLDQTGLAALTVPLTEEIPAREHILRVHSLAHYDSVKACPTTGTVAELAVSQVLGAVKAVSEGRVRNAFCAIRPPGHHMQNDGANYDGACQGRGFCFFSNVAIALRYAQSVLGRANALVIDWDYHFGNGTNWFVRTDPSVLFYSTHNYYAYPGTGDPLYTGDGAGVGYTVNVHLEPGATDSDIIGAWDRMFAPKMQQLGFRPDFVFISAGFDSRAADTLGVFAITDAGFATLTAKAMAIADQYCAGRLVSVLEGGYNPDGLARAVCAHVATLAGLDWQQYVPLAPGTPRRGKKPGTAGPQIRGGILRLPDSDAARVARIGVFGPSGRQVYAVPQEELGKTVVDLWQRELATAGLVVEITMRDGEKVRLPMEASPGHE